MTTGKAPERFRRDFPDSHLVTTLNFLVLLLPLGLLLAASRLVRPLRSRLVGTRLLSVRVPLLARLRMHTLPALVNSLLAVILTGEEIAPWWSIPAVLAVMAALMAVPTSYVLTTDGIRLGRAEFRRWTEFAGVARSRGGARLLGAAGARSYRIWLSGSRGDDEFLHLLRRLIKAAYKGAPAEASAPGPTGLGNGHATAAEPH